MWEIKNERNRRYVVFLSGPVWNRPSAGEAYLLQLQHRWSQSCHYRMLSLMFPPPDEFNCWLSARVAEVWFHVCKSKRAWLSFSIQSSLSCLVSAENQHLNNTIIDQCVCVCVLDKPGLAVIDASEPGHIHNNSNAPAALLFQSKRLVTTPLMLAAAKRPCCTLSD